MERSLHLTGLRGGATIITYMKFILEWFSIEFPKTKITELIDYKLDYAANLKP